MYSARPDELGGPSDHELHPGVQACCEVGDCRTAVRRGIGDLLVQSDAFD
jgi:hypothetical protein